MTSRKVFVYKNLHKDCWSIKQDGLVKAHTTDLDLCLIAPSASTSQGQGKGVGGAEEECPRRYQRIHRRPHECPLDKWGKRSTELATYNPYKYKSFVR